jgi:enamine deaminase RidA (YjgF/YER057c/UK114 family)
MSIEKKILDLGFQLPVSPTPVGSYVPLRVSGRLLFTSGQTARINGVRRYLGKVGADVSMEEGYLSSRDACLNCLGAIKAAIGRLDRINRVVKLVGYVNSAPGFNQQPKVIDGASDLLIALYGEEGRHARAAVGVSELPFDASVELEMIVEIDLPDVTKEGEESS